MRNIINISLSPEMAKSVKKEVKAGNYASVSEFFRYLIRSHKLAKELQEAEDDFNKGKNWKVLKSLKDLR